MTLEQKLDLLIADVEKLKKKSVYQKKWLSTQETSDYTGYKIGTLYQLNQKREVTTRKSGSGLQWKRESLDEYLEAREQKSKSELVEEYNKELKVA